MYFFNHQHKGSIPKNERQDGFTLIELLLYLSLATLMLAVLGGIGVNVLSSRTKAKAQEEVRHNAQFVLEQIGYAFEGAEAITQPQVQGSSTTLVLQMEEEDEDPTVITFENESIQIQKGTQLSESLIGNGVAVPSVVFTNVTQGDGAQALRVELHMEAYNPENVSAFEASSTFYTTYSIRP